jgi:hypothetical protein
MTGMKRNLNHVLEMIAIGYIMELYTSLGIVNDALKFVQQKTEQIDTLEKLD